MAKIECVFVNFFLRKIQAWFDYAQNFYRVKTLKFYQIFGMIGLGVLAAFIKLVRLLEFHYFWCIWCLY